MTKSPSSTVCFTSMSVLGLFSYAATIAGFRKHPPSAAVERLDRVRGTLSDDFDRSVREVAHPARDRARGCGLAGGAAETDTLNGAVDDEADAGHGGHARSLPRGYGRLVSDAGSIPTASTNGHPGPSRPLREISSADLVSQRRILTTCDAPRVGFREERIQS